MLAVRGLLRILGSTMLLGGILLALFPLMTEAYGRYRQHALAQQFQSQISSTTNQVILTGGEKERAGGVAGRALAFRLVIPKVWVDVMVTEGENARSLANGAVHYPGTALPGEEGNCVVSGHRTTYGSPFHWLDRVQGGDAIGTQTPTGWIWYVVEQVKLIPSSRLGDVIFGPKDNRLTLLTCNPLFSARERLIVVAKPGTPPVEGTRWIAAPLPKRTRRSEEQRRAGLEGPVMEWLRALGKQEGPPPGTGEPLPEAETRDIYEDARSAPTPSAATGPGGPQPAPRSVWDYQVEKRSGTFQSPSDGPVLPKGPS